MNVAWIMLDVSRFVVTAMVASTVIVEQDSDLNQIKWVAKVRLIPQQKHICWAKIYYYFL